MRVSKVTGGSGNKSKSTPTKTKQVNTGSTTKKSAKNKVAKATPVDSLPEDRRGVGLVRRVEAEVAPTIVLGEEGEVSGLTRLLRDEARMSTLVDCAISGFSVGTIAARLGIPGTTFHKWITAGQAEPESEYGDLWKILSENLAIARGLAEASLAKTNPQFYLTRGPGKLLGNDWAEPVSTEGVAQAKMELGQEMIDALKLLRQQDIDLNHIIDNDKLTIKTETPVITNVVVKETGIAVLQPLPTSMTELVHTIEHKFQLERDSQE